MELVIVLDRAVILGSEYFPPGQGAGLFALDEPLRWWNCTERSNRPGNSKLFSLPHLRFACSKN